MSEHLPTALFLHIPTRTLGMAVLTASRYLRHSLRFVCRCSVDQKVKVVAEAKIPKAADASKHKAGGGNVEIRQPTSTDSLLTPSLVRTSLPIGSYITCSFVCLFACDSSSGPQAGLEG